MKSHSIQHAAPSTNSLANHFKIPNMPQAVIQEKRAKNATGLPINDEPVLEKEADEMGRKATSFDGKSVALGNEPVAHEQAGSAKPIQMGNSK